MPANSAHAIPPSGACHAANPAHAIPQIDRVSHQAASHPLHFFSARHQRCLSADRTFTELGQSSRSRPRLPARPAGPAPGSNSRYNSLTSLAWRSGCATKCPSGIPRRSNPLAVDRPSPVRYACPFNLWAGVGDEAGAGADHFNSARRPVVLYLVLEIT